MDIAKEVFFIVVRSKTVVVFAYEKLVEMFLLCILDYLANALPQSYCSIRMLARFNDVNIKLVTPFKFFDDVCFTFFAFLAVDYECW